MRIFGFTSADEVGRLEAEVCLLKERLRELEAQKINPSTVIEAVLKRGVKWYDIQGLDYAGQVQYFSNAQIILQNEVFRNEVHALMSDLVEEIAAKAQDFVQVERLRYSFNGVQTLIERLDGIIDPRKSTNSNEEAYADAPKEE